MKPTVFLAALAANCLMLSNAIAADPNLPTYQVASGISGQLKSVGSDTLNNEMLLWSKGFMSLYPGVRMEVDGKGSATAPPALVEGSSQFGPMSRPMSAEEVDAFEKKYGYRPASFRVAVDALGVYVNKDNPIQCLTLQELNRIFSSTRRAAFGKDIKTWGQAGMTGEWETKPIVLYGRNSISGTYEFFREMALNGGDYKVDVQPQDGSESVVKAVASNKFAIGYSGIGYKTDGVRTIPVSSSAGRPCYDPSAEATYARQYPIARYLYVYLNKKPDQPLDPLRAEFIKYVLSKDGQKLVEKEGDFPITSEDRESDLKRLGIEPASK